MNARETRLLFGVIPNAFSLYRVLDDVKSGKYDDEMVPGRMKIDSMGAYVRNSGNMRELMIEIEDAITQRKAQLESKLST